MATIPAIKRYRRGDRLYVQAQRIWMILISFVMSPRREDSCPTTITYGDIAILMGYPDKRAGRTLGRQLGIIGEYCIHNELPCLNSIVVDQDFSIPGSGVVLHPGWTIEQEQRAVIDEDWFQYRIPTTGALRKVWES